MNTTAPETTIVPAVVDAVGDPLTPGDPVVWSWQRDGYMEKKVLSYAGLVLTVSGSWDVVLEDLVDDSHQPTGDHGDVPTSFLSEHNGDGSVLCASSLCRVGTGDVVYDMTEQRIALGGLVVFEHFGVVNVGMVSCCGSYTDQDGHEGFVVSLGHGFRNDPAVTVLVAQDLWSDEDYLVNVLSVGSVDVGLLSGREKGAVPAVGDMVACAPNEELMVGEVTWVNDLGAGIIEADDVPLFVVRADDEGGGTVMSDVMETDVWVCCGL